MGNLEGSPSFSATEEFSEEKSQERLQAQAEIFADRGVEQFSDDQVKLLKHSAELSRIKDLNHLPEDISPELRDLVEKHKDSYLRFLRQEKKLETSFIEENATVYKEKFQPIIKSLQEKMAQGDIKKLPEYLGSGSNGSAFRIEVDGKEYAAKFSRIGQANFELKSLIRAKGVPHTAQLASYSFEDGVVIMELLPGRNVTDCPPQEDPHYSDQHIIQLIETVRALDSKGIFTDPKPSNFLYDQEQGFSVMDFHLQREGVQYSLPSKIMDLRFALTARKFERLNYKADDYEEKAEAQEREKYGIFLPTMIRFLNLLQERYPDILEDWKHQQEERKKDPRTSVSPLINREDMSPYPELELYLKELEKMGF